MKLRNIALVAALAAIGAAQAQGDKWVIGQSAPLTGGNAKFGQDIRAGANAWFAHVNSKGGVQGRAIELLTLDDKNDRKTAGENAATLLKNPDVLALYGFASATLSLDALPLAEKSGTAFFGPFSGANPVRTNSPVLFTVRASYGEEMEKMLNFWTSLGLTRVSVIYYDDEVGKQNLEVVTQYLKKSNLAPQAMPIKRNAPITKADIQKLLSQNPQFLLNTTLSGAAAQIQKELVGMGKIIPTSSLSFVGADQYIAAAGPASAGVSIAQVVPSPTAQIPAVRECAQALEAAGVKSAMNTTHLEACFGAKVLTEGIRRARKPVTRQSLLDALANLGAYDLGGYKITFGNGMQHGSKFVELAMVTREGKLSTR
ncbi:ABC transporter substrate-binding protein [Caenimonas terrae]|uniref:ABC transporter substrate-binding protein n=1 Tax=Caenimonas terrae TaxID=696074 RepID=A0ABW0NDN4_9BURK